jgi:hypothetical protein
MATVVDPRHSQHVICVVGAKLDFARISGVVERVGGSGFDLDVDSAQDFPDDRMTEAFDVSADLVEPSFTDRDREAVAEHRAVGYVLGPRARSDDAFDVTVRMLELIAALLQEGGVDAAKSESSNITHGRERWLHLAASVAAANERVGKAGPLYSAFVRRPLSTGLVYHSCGMHLLGEPDVEITAADDDRGIEWMDALARYMLVEGGAARMRDGDTFGLQPESTRRVLRHRPCIRYREDDIHYNPWGYWRLAGQVPH